MGATSLFKEALVDDDYVKYQDLFNILELSVQRLGHFLLLAERITTFKTERYKVNPEPIDLSRIIPEVLKTLEKKLSQKDLKLKFEACTDGNDKCFAEKHLIDICLNEIVDNAIKYSEQGGEINVKTACDEEHIIIEITDNGPGFRKLF
jgi:signal transduction histidine kinase